VGARVIQDRPLGHANPGRAGGAIEAFDVNFCLFGQDHKMCEVVRDAHCGFTIGQDVRRIRVSDLSMGQVGAHMLSMCLGSGDSHDDHGEGKQHGGRVPWRCLAMNQTLIRAHTPLMMAEHATLELMNSSTHSTLVEQV
jgi:hypothetical protein